MPTDITHHQHLLDTRAMLKNSLDGIVAASPQLRAVAASLAPRDAIRNSERFIIPIINEFATVSAPVLIADNVMAALPAGHVIAESQVRRAIYKHGITSNLHAVYARDPAALWEDSISPMLDAASIILRMQDLPYPDRVILCGSLSFDCFNPLTGFDAKPARKTVSLTTNAAFDSHSEMFMWDYVAASRAAALAAVHAATSNEGSATDAAARLDKACATVEKGLYGSRKDVTVELPGDVTVKWVPKKITITMTAGTLHAMKEVYEKYRPALIS